MLAIAGTARSQTRITEYFHVVADIEKLMKENQKLMSLLQQGNRYSNSDENSITSCALTPILRQILCNAERNASKLPTGRRHPEILKKFCTALFIYCGPLAYEFIQQNMPEALPSVRTIQSVIYKEYRTLDEGSFRYDELALHIKQHEAPNLVSIGEDATRVIARADYDSETDRCVGFVLPVDKNGLPEVDAFLAVSFSAIENMFHNTPLAKYAYVYMAQPLYRGVPPFCLACMGTDNKFTAQHVMLRWKHIYMQCWKRNIQVVSFGGDGDSRLMKAMRISVCLATPAVEPLLQEVPSCALPQPYVPKDWGSWFHITPKSISYVQDVVHVAVKLKSRLLRPSIILPMGQYVAAGNHLRMIQLAFGKEQHALRERDVNPRDKQNFDAVLHLLQASHLLDKIPGTTGTKTYLEVIRCVVDSYLDKSLDPAARIERMWYAVFLLRYWRQWILLHHDYTLKNNFVTNNAYMCVELNAHALITFVMTIQVCGDSTSFLPWLLGSQTCERTFRAARSMSSTFSTIINFGMLGLLRRLHRLQIQFTLQSESNQSLGIMFPRIQKHRVKEGNKAYVEHSLEKFTSVKIFEAVKKAKIKAMASLETLGMAELLKKHSMWESLRKPDNIPEDDFADEKEEDDDKETEMVNPDKRDTVVSSIIQEVCPEELIQVAADINNICRDGLVDSDVKKKAQRLQETLKLKRIPSSTIPMFTEVKQPNLPLPITKHISPFVEVHRGDHTFYIRKTTAVWLFQECEHVSSDRLFRVRCKQPYASDSSICTLRLPSVDKKVVTSQSVQVGDLCVFKVNDQTWKIGRVLQFAQYTGKSLECTQQYGGYSADVSTKHGVLCAWYDPVPGSPRTFQQRSDCGSTKYQPLSCYVCSLTENCLEDDGGSDCNGSALLPQNKLFTSLTRTQISIQEECTACIELLSQQIPLWMLYPSKHKHSI